MAGVRGLELRNVALQNAGPNSLVFQSIFVAETFRGWREETDADRAGLKRHLPVRSPHPSHGVQSGAEQAGWRKHARKGQQPRDDDERSEDRSARDREEGTSIEEIERRGTHSVPLRRANEPEDIAAMIVFLALPGASNITGQAFNVDGGLVPH